MDTIGLILNRERVPNTNLMTDIAQYLTVVSFEGVSYELPTINGKLDSFDVSINPYRVKLGKASLTKFLLGNNVSMIGRKGIEQAIDKMSDALHLPFKDSMVSMFHYPKNIILKHDVGLYLPYLGNCGRFKRLEQPNGINYKKTGIEFAIYDKIKEIKYRREQLPPLFTDRNMIRLESRYNGGLNKYFNRFEILGSTLYDELFYKEVVDDWLLNYHNIDKIKLSKIDMKEITTKKDMQLLGVLSLVQREGGKMQALENLKERYKKSELTKKQHYDLRKLIEASSKMRLQTVDSDLIIELNKKVKEAIKFYR